MTSHSDEKGTGRVYMRGLYDGLKLAGIEHPGEWITKQTKSMNQSRFNSLYAGMTAVAKRVYEATPIQEQWTGAQIQAELSRTGTNRDPQITMGCLRSLVNSGMVMEPERGKFIRTPVREKHQKQTDTTEYANTKKPERKEPELAQKNTQFSVAERLGTIADNAKKIADSIKTLASEIETAAIEIEEHIGNQSEGLQQLDQLRQLLKSIG